jgi:protein-disulfide isomerase
MQSMSLDKNLVSVVAAAAVAAITAAGTSYLVCRYAPLGLGTGPVSADQSRVERIIRDYLTKNPEILVEMTAALDKRQAADQIAQQQKAISDNTDAIFRSPVSHVAGNPNGDVSGSSSSTTTAPIAGGLYPMWSSSSTTTERSGWCSRSCRS